VAQRIAVHDLPVPLDGAPPGVIAYPSLITDPEKALLYRLARDYFRGEGSIVDAGIFLGASTHAFATGLRANSAAMQRIPAGRKPITSYELGLFVESMRKYIGRDAFRAKLGDWNPANGESFEPILRQLLADHADLVDLRIGDLAKLASADGPVEIAFYDCLKSAQLDGIVFRTFGPHYIAGHTIVIQQDYFYAGAPEHRLRQELLSDHFRFLGQLDASAVFRFEKPIPPAMFEANPLPGLTLADELRLFDQAAARSPFPLSKTSVLLSAAAYVRRRHGMDAALAIKQNIERDFPAELQSLLKYSQASGRLWRTLTKE
jgi:hypothetical protein